MSTGGGGDQVKERMVELCTTPLTDCGDADGAEKENHSDPQMVTSIYQPYVQEYNNQQTGWQRKQGGVHELPMATAISSCFYTLQLLSCCACAILL